MIIPLPFYLHYGTVKLTVNLSDVTRSARVPCVWILICQLRLLKAGAAFLSSFPFGLHKWESNFYSMISHYLTDVVLTLLSPDLNIFFTMTPRNVQTTTFIITL